MEINTLVFSIASKSAVLSLLTTTVCAHYGPASRQVTSEAAQGPDGEARAVRKQIIPDLETRTDRPAAPGEHSLDVRVRAQFSDDLIVERFRRVAGEDDVYKPVCTDVVTDKFVTAIVIKDDVGHGLAGPCLDVVRQYRGAAEEQRQK